MKLAENVSETDNSPNDLNANRIRVGCTVKAKIDKGGKGLERNKRRRLNY